MVVSVDDGDQSGQGVPGPGGSGSSRGGGGRRWGVVLLVVLVLVGVGGWYEYGSDVRSWFGQRSGSVPSSSTVVEAGGGFDPFVTSSVSGIDLGRLRDVVESLRDPDECPAVATVDSLDDVAEVLRLVDGCLVLSYEPLVGRSIQDVAAQFEDDSGVLAVGRPLRGGYRRQPSGGSGSSESVASRSVGSRDAVGGLASGCRCVGGGDRHWRGREPS